MDGNYSSGDTTHGYNFLLFNSLLSNDGKLDQSVIDDVSPDDPAIIMFTSGTTGKPKGAYLSHFTLVNNALLTKESFDFGEPISMLIPLPFFHSFAAVLGNISMTAVPFTSG
ncbi:unnamed protein product, partial [Oppiella nova]